MSELSIYQPTASSQACVRSFVLASKAPKITAKEEVLILSRLMSATLGYSSVFWNFLKTQNTSPLQDCQMMAARSKRTAFLVKQNVAEKDHAGFVSDAKFLFEDLGHYARDFDQRRGMDSGVRNIIKVADAFITAQDSARKQSMENGLPALNYINPYVAVNVASTVIFDICKDIEVTQPDRSPADIQFAIKPLCKYLDQVMKEYPVNLSPNGGALSYKNDDVRNRIFGTYVSLEDHMHNIPEISADTSRAAKHGLACVKNYLSPFVQNIRERPLNTKASILTFSDWTPLVEKAREKRAQREAQEKSGIYAPRNDL